MKIDQFNDLIRDIINKIIHEYSNVYGISSKLMKAISGTSATGAMSIWLKRKTNYGIKPLQKILKVSDYDLYLVAVKKDDMDTKQILEDYNYQFADQFDKLIRNFAEHSINTDQIRRYDNVVDSVIEELIKSL